MNPEISVGQTKRRTRRSGPRRRKIEERVPRSRRRKTTKESTSEGAGVTVVAVNPGPMIVITSQRLHHRRHLLHRAQAAVPVLPALPVTTRLDNAASDLVKVKNGSLRISTSADPKIEKETGKNRRMIPARTTMRLVASSLARRF